MFEIFTDELLDKINAYRQEKGLWAWPQNEDLQRLALAWAFWGRLREVTNLNSSPLEAYFPPTGFTENTKIAGKICGKVTKAEVLQIMLEEHQKAFAEPVVYQAGTALIFDGKCWIYVVLLAR